MSDTEQGTMSGLTAAEAKEFHKLFMSSFLGFTAVAAVAHFLVWLWRPWIPGPNGYTTSALDHVQTAITTLLG